MASILKDYLNKDFYDYLANLLAQEQNEFDKKSFKEKIFFQEWDALELKQRIRHSSKIVDKHLSGTYNDKILIILNIIDKVIKDNRDFNTLVYMFIPDYVEVYGINDYDTSISAIEKITQFVSCEFTVRQFILKYKETMMSQMLAWSLHSSEHLRRLASEGCRPRLPWAIALEDFKKDPDSIIPILENLKNDKSEYVRRSVANNLNDISKDNPKICIDICSQWIGNTSNTDKLVKHACRSLLKQGDATILSLFEYCDIEQISMSDFRLENSKISMGEHLNFSFMIKNIHSSEAKLRIEYAIYHMKNNGKLSKKIFKISEFTLPANKGKNINKRHHIKYISTRKYYEGLHKIAVIINGIESESLDFMLKK